MLVILKQENFYTALVYLAGFYHVASYSNTKYIVPHIAKQQDRTVWLQTEVGMELVLLIV